MSEHINCVVGNNAQILDASFIRPEHAMADAGLVDLDAKEVSVRVRCGLFYQRFAVAKTNLDDDRPVCAEKRVEFE